MDAALRQKRKRRSRAKTRGTGSRPRVSVFRSLNSLYLQIIDDEQGVTLAAAKSAKGTKKSSKIDSSFAAGQALAQVASKAGIKAVVFDRGGYRFHGRVKAAADGLRKGGLEF